MSSSGAGSSKKRGHYASRACNGCRRRRCKCDEVHPTCGSCSFYGHECSWSREDDARRPATKQLVETLKTKIQVLEAEVARLHAQNNPGGVAPTAVSNTASLYPSNTWDQGELLPTQLGASSSESDSFPNISPHVITSNPVLYNVLSSPMPGYQTELPYLEHPPTPIVDHYISQPIYQYIFYINTSIPVSELPEGARLSLACDWSRHLVPFGDIQLSRHEHDVLLQRFFNYQVIWLIPMIPEVFLHNMLYSNTHAESLNFSMPYYSAFLHCSLLAFAAAFSDDPNIRSLATRSHFAGRAKQLLDSEFARPTHSLVQALTLLAEYYCGIGERNAGYMYLGMGVRAAQALGIFTENQFETNIQSGLSLDAMIRSWGSWSIFSQDKLMALDYGRDYDVPLPHAGTVLPIVDPEFDNRAWPWLPQHGLTPADAQRNRTTQVFYESCKLILIITQIADSIYHHSNASDSPEDSKAINLHLQLDTWFNNLPRELLVYARSNMAPLPHVIILNICYWWTLIYLYRPFYPQGQTAGQSTRDSRLFADLSIKMCDRAAHKIVQLIRIFRQSHSLQYFPRNMLQVITACGTTLLLQEATVSESALKKRSVAQEGVDVCTSALREIALTWPYARELAEQLEGRVSGQIRDPPVASSSAPVPSSLEAFAEPELDDQEVSRMFYRFVHEWGQDEPESPYSSGQHSQGSSPMLSSSYPLMGEISMDTFGQSGWGQALHPSSSLYQHNVSAPHPPDGSFHGEGGGDARY